MYHDAAGVASILGKHHFGNFNEIIDECKELNIENPKVLALLASSQFFTGSFIDALKTYDKLYKDPHMVSFIKVQFGLPVEEFDCCKGILYYYLERIKDHLPQELPEKIDLDYPQSYEDSLQDYDEFIEFNRLLKDPNCNDRLLKFKNSANPVHQAKYFYFLAEDAWSGNDFEKAYDCYYQAALIEEQKALYYGFAGNMLLKLRLSGNYGNSHLMLFTASELFNRAIALDYNNSKWHFYKSLILYNIANFMYNNFKPEDVAINIYRSSHYEALKAKELVRADQERLKSTIENHLARYESQ